MQRTKRRKERFVGNHRTISRSTFDEFEVQIVASGWPLDESVDRTLRIQKVPRGELALD